MHVIKWIGGILLTLVVLVLILGLVAPREIEVAESISIQAPPQQVYATVSDFNTWPQWSPWFEKDSTMQLTMGEKMQGAGASYSWTSEQSGSGSQSITAATPPQSIDTHIDFGNMGAADGHWDIQPASGGSAVTWSFHSKMPYPMNDMLLFQDMKGAIAEDFRRGLANLKEQLEQATSEAAGSATIESQQFGGTYLVKRETLDFAQVADFIATQLPTLLQSLTAAGHAPTGPATGLYYSWDEENQRSDMAIGFPVAAGTQLDGYTTLTLPTSDALRIDHYGSPGTTAAAHQQLDQEVNRRERQLQSPVIEVYVTDPAQEPDSSRWLTQIVYLMQSVKG